MLLSKLLSLNLGTICPFWNFKNLNSTHDQANIFKIVVSKTMRFSLEHLPCFVIPRKFLPILYIKKNQTAYHAESKSIYIFEK